jgi:hypothetical protein
MERVIRGEATKWHLHRRQEVKQEARARKKKEPKPARSWMGAYNQRGNERLVLLASSPDQGAEYGASASGLSAAESRTVI